MLFVGGCFLFWGACCAMTFLAFCGCLILVFALGRVCGDVVLVLMVDCVLLHLGLVGTVVFASGGIGFCCILRLG